MLKQILKDKKFELENKEVESKDIKMSFNILLDNYEKAQIDNDEYTKKIDIMIAKSLQTENKIKNVYLRMNHKAEKVENLEKDINILKQEIKKITNKNELLEVDISLLKKDNKELNSVIESKKHRDLYKVQQFTFAC